MAFNLDCLSTPTLTDPQTITIFGEPGMGKTTLAASFPRPVFIRTEDGTTTLAGRTDIFQFPVAASSDEVIDQIKALIREDHNLKTLVIDSVSQLDAMILREVISSDGKAKSLNQAHGGYGAAVDIVVDKHYKVVEQAALLKSIKGMNIVYIAHAHTQTISPPDAPEFHKFVLSMNKNSSPPYQRLPDVVARVKLETFYKGEKKEGAKKAVSGGRRLVSCYEDDASVQKNRYHIKDDIEFIEGENPFAAFFPQFNLQEA